MHGNDERKGVCHIRRGATGGRRGLHRALTGCASHVDQMLTNVDLQNCPKFRRVATNPESGASAAIGRHGKPRKMLTNVNLVLFSDRNAMKTSALARPPGAVVPPTR